MSTYAPPSLIFRQEFTALAGPARQDLFACILGPKKKIVRVDLSPDDEVNYGDYNSLEPVTYELKVLPSGELVESSDVVVELRNVHGLYGELTGTNVIEVGDSPSKVILGSAKSGARLVAGTAPSGNTFDRTAEIGDRDVKIGDRVKVVHDSGTLWTRITSLLPAYTDPVFSAGTDSNASSNPITQVAYFSPTIVINNGGGTRLVGDFIEDTSGDRYIGSLKHGVVSDLYTLEVITPGGYSTAQFSVTSTSGDNVASVTLGANDAARLEVGTRGLGIKIDNVESRAFVAGEKITIQVKCPYTQMEVEVVDDTYTGNDAIYQVKVVRGGTWASGPRVTVTTNTNTDRKSVQTVELDTAFSIGDLGPTVKFVDNTDPQDGLRLGDIYNITVTGKKANGINAVTLKDPLPQFDDENNAINSAGTDLTVSFYSFQDRVVIDSTDYNGNDGDNWELVGGENITLKSGIYVFDPSVKADGVEIPVPVEKATVYVSYSCTVKADNGKTGSISTFGSIPEILGQVLPENPIAYGVSKALFASAGQPVYYIVTSGDTPDDYTEALKVATVAADIYYISPMTQNEEVIDLVCNHVKSLSDPRVGIERAAIVSKSVADVIPLYSKDENDDSWTGYISAGPENNPIKYRMAKMPGATFVTDGVRAGDILRTNYSITEVGDEIYESYVVESVTDEENLLVVGGPQDPVGNQGLNQPFRMEIFRSMTPSEQAELCAAQSSALGSRRVVNVFPDVAVDVNGIVPGYYMSAAIAGLKSSIAPHQPITNFNVPGFTGTPKVFRFTLQDLNTIASGGTMIVVQDSAVAAPYIRHQLTTDMTDENHMELSITSNVDSITKWLRGFIKPRVGKYNITDDYLLELVTLCYQRLDYLSNTTSTLTAGPQVLSVGNITATRNPNIRTGIQMSIPIEVGYPGNNIEAQLIIN